MALAAHCFNFKDGFMKIRLGAIAVMACALLLTPHHAPAQKKSAGASPTKASGPVDEAVRAVFGTHRFEQAVISPDGKNVAWVEDVITKTGAPTSDSVIYVQDIAGQTKPRRIEAGVADAIHAEGSAAWSPDGKKIAFLSDAQKAGQLQLYVIDAAGGAPRRLTQVKGFLASPAWSPDGKTIGVLFTENATRAAGPLVAETPETGEIKDAFFEQRLALVDAGGGELRQISPPDMYVYEFDWSPDSKHLAVTAAPGNGDNNWYIAQLYTIAAAGGAMKSICKPPLQIASPAWSPDGKRIAFIGGLMSDEPSVGGDIFTIPAAGGEAANLTPGIKASASWLSWTPGGKVLFGEFVEGDSAIATLDPADGRVTQLFRDAGQVTAGAWGVNLSVSRDAKSAAVVRSSFNAPPEIWAGPIGAWKQITHRNVELKPVLGKAKSIHWNNEGFDVQGWLIYPRNFDPAKKYPLIVHVHGGPGAAFGSQWPSTLDYTAALSGAGYFVLHPNPRGSFGQGEAFTRANVKDFGYGDFRDILAGVDEAIRVAPIDPARLGICGWSYGGFMTMWAVTQTNRFKAAMAGAGLSNWQSYYGENLIDQWMIPFFGKSVYDDPQVYARSSPINFIKNAATPTLIIVGDSDGECPTPQSYEFWHALKTLAVETKFVVYEHEGHMFANPRHRRDVIERTLAWFDGHLH
ncbi:MAG TPA: S9 family peptidase [Methylomirabilota bacterium]|nr:S9 family peptidase [Methylomirabilota bacterium]